MHQLPTPYGFRDTARQPIQTPWVKTIPQQPLRAVGKKGSWSTRPATLKTYRCMTEVDGLITLIN